MPGGQAATYPIAGDQLSTEAYGAVVQKDAPGFIEVVKNILERAQADGTWAESYHRWIEPLEPDSDPEPPTMTVEEAAALFPVVSE
jgi:ABC-type amino acid transport substrate-binding protein